MHAACIGGKVDCAVELVNAGCDTSLQDGDGNTGWDHAECQGHSLLIRRCKLAKRQRSKALPHQNTKADAVAAEPVTLSAPRQGAGLAFGDEARRRLAGR